MLARYRGRCSPAAVAAALLPPPPLARCQGRRGCYSPATRQRPPHQQLQQRVPPAAPSAATVVGRLPLPHVSGTGRCGERGKDVRVSGRAGEGAYRVQFQGDFHLFLACRAEEVRRGDLLLLTFVARREAVPLAHDCHLWDLLAAAVEGMAAEGLVDTHRLDSFDTPYYRPCLEEFTEAIREEGFFELRRMELFEIVLEAKKLGKTIWMGKPQDPAPTFDENN
ncbi:hypothetical protein E2562_023067 [Oryza meyeriana var. granulata]|uniref:Uncharacterized protein n=1 Tax=Oryza meyeriana var. granulata TaxID=110450 RepID=A0A6G1ENZ8_9ORYZ|nr:hypothetical protein E2562_023067 [Oryza meyeriana var. granulata]